MIYFDTTFNGDREVGDIIECKVTSPADKLLVSQGEEVRVQTPVQRSGYRCKPLHQLPGGIWRLEILEVLR